jgi:predicted nucleic acid-binding protein
LKQYFDTSVLVAYYSPESMSAKAEKLLRKASPPVISRLAEVEFASAVSRKIRDRELAEPAGNKILNLFQSHVTQGFYHVLSMEGHHFEQAREWISRFDTPLRTLDALHLTLAALENAQLITADRQLHEGATLLGVDSLLLTARQR